MFVTLTLIISFTIGIYVYNTSTEFDWEKRFLAKVSMSLASLAYILQSFHNFNN